MLYSGEYVTAYAIAVHGDYEQATNLGRWLMDTWANARVVLFLVGLPALFVGFSFPLGNALVQRGELEVGRRAGILYLANTGGNVAGAVVAGFVFLTLFGVQVSVIIFATGAVLSALLLLPFAVRGDAAKEESARTGRTALALGVAAAVAAIITFGTLPPSHLIDRMFEFSRSGNETVIVAMHEGVNETLMITEFSQGGRRLHTNGHRMSSTALFTQRYMRAAAHIPLLQLDAPQQCAQHCLRRRQHLARRFPASDRRAPRGRRPVARHPRARASTLATRTAMSCSDSTRARVRQRRPPSSGSCGSRTHTT